MQFSQDRITVLTGLRTPCVPDWARSSHLLPFLESYASISQLARGFVTSCNNSTSTTFKGRYLASEEPNRESLASFTFESRVLACFKRWDPCGVQMMQCCHSSKVRCLSGQYLPAGGPGSPPRSKGFFLIESSRRQFLLTTSMATAG